MKNFSRFVLLSVIASAALAIAAGPSRETLQQTASVAQLEAAIARNVKALDALLADETKFADNLTRDKISAKAASTAGLAQAVLDHPDAKTAKSLGDYVRESAKRLAESDSHAAAKRHLGEVKLAAEGKPLGYDSMTEDDWYNVMTMEHMMEEMNQLQNDLRRTIRRLNDPEAESLDALAAAVLSLACKENLDYVGGDEDEAAWKNMSQQLYDEYRLMSVAMRKKDSDAARAHHANAARLCTECHDKFRD
jgi:hypothetical protein